MITLRDYQQEAVDEIRTALKQYRRVLFQLNTGGGKTIIFSYIALCSQKYSRKVLILSNRTEILRQNGGTLSRIGLDVDYISPKHREIPQKNVVVGMSQTLRRRLQSEEWREYVKSIELLICDEAHCCDHDFIYDYLETLSGDRPDEGVLQLISMDREDTIEEFDLFAKKEDKIIY